MRPFKPLVLLIGVSLSVAGCARNPYLSDGWLDVQHELQQSSTEKDPSGDLMYQLLVGELAGRRGDLPLALESYSQASVNTQDPRIAARATQLAVYSNEWDKALLTGEKWSKLAPESIEAQRLLSAIYLKVGNPEAAGQALHRVVELSGQDVDVALRGITMHLMRESDQSAAMDVMKLVTQQYPSHASAHFGLAQLALKSGDINTAISALGKVRALNPDSSEAVALLAKARLQMKQYDEGIAELNPYLMSHPNDLDAQVLMAQLQLGARHYSDAEAQFEKIFKLSKESPQHSQIAYSLGIWAFEAQHYQASKRYLKYALEAGANEAESSYFIATISDNDKDYNEAIEYYLKVKDSEYVLPAQLRVAEIYALQGKDAQALTLLKELQGIYTSPSHQSQLYLSEAKMHRQQGRLSQAMAVMDKSLELDKNNVDLLYNRAIIAEAMGDGSLFEEDMRRILVLEPSNAHALNALGYFFVDKNENLDEAEKMIVKALSLMPNDPAVIDSMGWLRYRQGEYAESIKYLRAAYAILPDPEIASHLGEVLWNIGETKDAKEVLLEAQRNAPSDQGLNSVINKLMP